MENIAKGAAEITIIEDGFHVIRLKNDSAEKAVFEHHVDSNFLQFHYCLKGNVQLAFNQGSYKLDLKEQNSYLLYNPSRDLPMDLSISPQTWFVSVLISIKKFHSLFSPDAEHVSFLSPENKDKKYYVDGKISPSMAVALHQLMNYNLNDTIKQLYFKGKSYELLSLYFNREEDANLEACPFLADEENMRKIKRAKEIVIERMIDLPSLPDLALEIGLSLKKLKEGFKEVYGDTVYGFALDHKMDYARQLLDTGQYNVNEVGLKVGYSTGSHFISAFKKKYGTTPKKYLSGS
ncbi:AraC family transcriptional regulator [Nonlabens dokdonensis]|uniref:Transcriptional regulator, AraC family n=2 Tax=Nonlabens dokdonensis TaxID=328515 RepID=L7W5C7_NONDD|nr:AraC family transcriptional regulator [Nonlabens dokdonensis]AGC76835.1 transcriptional regulator, AraC family [Nonlabens dokdonensis DSW-6]PZX44476.1 AraC family transcriptional regulator [Nonlabens dokdonensis]